MTLASLQPDIARLIEHKEFVKLKKRLAGMEIHDLSDLMNELEGEHLAICFRLLHKQVAAWIFGDLPHEKAEELLRTMSSDKMAAILNEMAPDERTDLLEELPGEMAQRLMNLLRGDERKVARDLLAYPEESIGRLMTPEYVAVRPNWTVERVFEHLRSVGTDKETLNVLFVVDNHWNLLDEISLEQFVLAEPGQTVEDLMDRQVAFLGATDDEEVAIEMFKKYDAVVLPVVNSQGVLVGIVTHDDIMDLAEEEDTEDLHKMIGLEPLETSYFETRFWPIIRKRLPWLAMLLVAQTLTAVSLIQFEAVTWFATFVVFMPMINSPAGNTGAQIAGLMIRGLALQEIEMNHWHRVLLRELYRGPLMGLFLGAMGCGLVVMLQRPLAAGLAVAVAITIAVTIANVLGAMLPFLFKRLKVDPAVTSGPFIASMMDVSAILIYFTTAAAVLKVMGQ